MSNLETPDIYRRHSELAARVSVLERLLGIGDVIETLKVNLFASGAGNTLVVGAVAGQKIVVVSYDLMVSANVVVEFRSGASTRKAGPYNVPLRGGKVNAENPSGWLETNVGEALNINLATAVTLGGALSYRLE